MKKLLLATIFVLTAFCVCNSKTKDTSVEKEHVSQVKKSTRGWGLLPVRWMGMVLLRP